VSYADDYVICCRGTAEQAMTEMRRLMTQLKLTINEAKTDIRQLPQERFDFLATASDGTTHPRRGKRICARNRRRRASSASSERSERRPNE
jgi:RNA-directed DNA polymerase